MPSGSGWLGGEEGMKRETTQEEGEGGPTHGRCGAVTGRLSGACMYVWVCAWVYG
jgi:hypothetical protein